MTPGVRSAGNQVDINDLTVFAQKNLSRDGYVSIAGTVAKARLASPSEFPGLADRWSSKTLTIGGGFGAFGASIVGHVTDTPGQPKWEGLGLGLAYPVERPAHCWCRQCHHPWQKPVLGQQFRGHGRGRHRALRPLRAGSVGHFYKPSVSPHRRSFVSAEKTPSIPARAGVLATTRLMRPSA